MSQSISSVLACSNSSLKLYDVYNEWNEWFHVFMDVSFLHTGIFWMSCASFQTHFYKFRLIWTDIFIYRENCIFSIPRYEGIITICSLWIEAVYQQRWGLYCNKITLKLDIILCSWKCLMLSKLEAETKVTLNLLYTFTCRHFIWVSECRLNFSHYIVLSNIPTMEWMSMARILLSANNSNAMLCIL